MIRNWSLGDVSESYNLWTLFGLWYNDQTEEIEPENLTGTYRVKGTNYPYVWREVITGHGHLPCKSATSVECPFLKDDPGDGSRPCALVGSQDDGSRQKFCRPEERAEPPANYDIWSQESKEQWEADHPNCSYVFTEIIE